MAYLNGNKIAFTPKVTIEGGGLPALEQPVVSLNGDILSWAVIGGAIKYLISIDDDDLIKSTMTNSVDLFQLDIAEGNHSIKVKAIGDNENFIDSIYSDSVQYTALLPDLTGTSWRYDHTTRTDVEGTGVVELFSIVNYSNWSKKFISLQFCYRGSVDSTTGLISETTTNNIAIMCAYPNNGGAYFTVTREKYANTGAASYWYGPVSGKIFTFNIIGGADATNKTLINWFYKYCTRIS